MAWMIEPYNKKLSSFLETHKIEIVETIWKDVNELHHEVIWTIPVEDEKQKWKIIQEVTKWYVIEKSSGKKVLLPAKVIIWQ